MLEIKSLNHDFNGIGKLNEKVIFVKDALPGEVVDIKIIKEKKSYSEAIVTKYIKTSKNRVKPKCKYFGFCGGCNIMNINYLNQLKCKEEKINNIIKKYIKKDVKINPIIYDNDIGYRNKIKFQIGNKVGFFKNNSYEVINIDNCKIANKKINQSIPYLNNLDLTKIKNITCRTAQDKLMIIIETKNNNDIDISPILNVSDSIYLNDKHIYKDKTILEKLDEFEYIISPQSFFQINKNICLKLYRKIKEYVGENNKVLDLYCGCGSIGIFVSKNNEVLGVEINKSAIKDANKNKKLNKLNKINFICGDSSIENNFKPNIIIVDPPRSGLNDKTIKKINKLKPEKLIYVSCDPMTLVRDLNKLDLFNIVEITPFDMFPNTKHCESLCLLRKK